MKYFIVFMAAGAFLLAGCHKSNPVTAAPAAATTASDSVATMAGTWNFVALVGVDGTDSLMYRGLSLTGDADSIESVSNTPVIVGTQTFPYVNLVVGPGTSDSLTIDLYYVSSDSLYGSAYGAHVIDSTLFLYHCFALRDTLQ